MLSAVLGYVLTKGVIRWQYKLGVVDDPVKTRQKNNTHIYPVPRGGGLAIGVATIAVLLVWAGMIKESITLVVCIGMAMVIGFADDRWQGKVSPYLRLTINVMVGIITWMGGLGIKYVTGWNGEMVFFGQMISLIATCIWLVWMQNIVGWSSGVDGQLPGFVIVAALTVGLWSGFREGFNPPELLPIVSVVTAGVFLGFLGWNWYPQKIMPGYGGKSLAGYLLGVIAILADVKLTTMAMVLAVPFVDAGFAIIKRLSEGRSPVWGGRDHLHHYLLDKGWGKRQVAIFYLLTSLFGGILSTQLKAEAGYFTMATVILSFAGLVLWLRNWSLSSKHPGQDSGSKI